MHRHSITQNNRFFILTGLSIALIISVLLSPFASKNPDGLDRVAQDLNFKSKAQEDHLAKKLPFFSIFEEYTMRGVPESIATPLAGLVGTIATFGLSMALGKLTTRQRSISQDDSTLK
ncbi:MAG: PDGLE domain-containing protein [Alkalinema sp. CAN_BIN05]|nr:PDGLE domain-containing protein [Alkalinema sp. CAN_BIN05]